MSVALFPRIEDVRNAFEELWTFRREEGIVVSGTLEVIGASFVADEPTIFGAVNEDYVERELEWYLSQSLNVNDIPGRTPRIWEAVSDLDGRINSNYGYLLYSEENVSQYNHVKEQLVLQPEGRRAVAVYTRPSIHLDWNARGMADFICTNAVNYYHRHGELHAVVQMRSNDAVFGYRNDYAWQKYVLEQMAGELNFKPGNIIWQPGSIHVYERHWHLIEHYSKTGEHDIPLS